MRYRNPSACLALLALLCHAETSDSLESQAESAGRQAAIHGTVLPTVGSNRLPPGISVTLLSLDLTEQRVVQAVDGVFIFTEIPEQNYELVVACRGHRDANVALPRSAFVNGVARLSILVGAGLLLPELKALKGNTAVDLAQLAIPDKALREYDKGSAAFQGGKLGEALLHLRRAVERAPDFVEAINKTAATYLRIGDFHEAERMFTKSLKLQPENFAARKGMGYICLASKRFDGAIHHLATACSLAPEEAECHGWLGGALYETAQYERAELELSRALELDPRLEEFANLLQHIRQKRKVNCSRRLNQPRSLVSGREFHP